MADGALQGYDALRRRIAAISGPVLGKDIMRTLGMAVIGEAGVRAPRKTGHLIQSMEPPGGLRDVTGTSARVVVQAPYGRFVEEGTGLFGPKHQRITPVAKKVMRWMGGPTGAFTLGGRVRSGKAGAGAFAIFARSTKGMKARPFLKPGAEAAIGSAGLAERIVSAWDKAA